jgi:uncharacterized protein YegP (UPF0339 family)
MEIHIIKKWWLRQKYHATIVDTNTQITWTSENHYNRLDLEKMIAHTKKNLPNATIVYDFELKQKNDKSTT